MDDSVVAMESAARELLQTCRDIQACQPVGSTLTSLPEVSGEPFATGLHFKEELDAIIGLLEQGVTGDAAEYRALLQLRVAELQKLVARLQARQAKERQALHRQHNAAASPLLDLPEPILAQIAHATGRRAREACSQLRDAYGCPAHGLTLAGPDGEPARILQAWKWPRHVRHLRLGCPVPLSETGPLLAAIAAHLPGLRTLVWHGSGTDEGPLPPATPPLPALTSLTWTRGGACTLRRLPCLAPAIRHLTVQLRSHLWPDPAPATGFHDTFTCMMLHLPHLTSIQLEICHLHTLPIVRDLAAGLLTAAPSLAALSLLHFHPNEVFGELATCLRQANLAAALTRLTSLTINNASTLDGLPGWSQRLTALQSLDLTGYTHAADWGRHLDYPADNATLRRLRLPAVDLHLEDPLHKWLERTAPRCRALTALRVGLVAAPERPPHLTVRPPHLPTWLTPVGRLASLRELHITLDVDHCPYLTGLQPLAALSYLSLTVESHRHWNHWSAPDTQAACAATFAALDAVHELRLEVCKASRFFKLARATFLRAAFALPALRVLDLTHFTDLGGDEVRALRGAVAGSALRRVRLQERCLGARPDAADRDALLAALEELPVRVVVEVGRARARV